MNKDIFEIIFFARAGQGAKSAAEILAQTAMKENKNVQAFPYYGPQRSGAPTRVYFKISENEIRSHEPVKSPDLFVVMDETLLKTEYVKNKLEISDKIIINTSKSIDAISKIIGKKYNECIEVVDASGIAKELTGKEKPNGVILGKIVKISGIVELEGIISEFKNIFGKKLSDELIEKNILAIKKGFEKINSYEKRFNNKT